MAYYCGCDVGSTYAKAVILDEDGNIVGTSLIRTQIDPEETSRQAIGDAMAEVDGLDDIEKLAYLVGTGYGRNEVPFANENISEISCHAMGVFTCNPGIRSIVDVGGQDVKSIGVDEDGTVRDFHMNDKCAAGTGRFFEGMARALGVEVTDFAELSKGATEDISITSQCSVFAETEVISLLAQKKTTADVAAGIQKAVAKRCFTLLKGVGVREKVTVTGGCAKNQGLIEALEKLARVKIEPLQTDPQLMGALGAAVIARRKGQAKTLNKTGS